MIQSILKADSTTGWTASSGASLTGVTSEMIAGINTAAIMASFGTATGLYIEYVFPVAITIGEFEDIIFHMFSQNHGKQDYRSSADFSYKIAFGASGKEYYLPIYDTFTDISLHIVGLTTIDKIKITKTVAGEDNLVLSNFVLQKQDVPLDIFIGVKEQIEYYRDKLAKITLGTLANLVSGVTSIIFPSDVEYIDRYACIKIYDGTNFEIHQIAIRHVLTFEFTDLYDGKSLVHSYTSATIELFIPIEYGIRQKEILVPSITIWGMEPEEEKIDNGISMLVDSYKTDDTFSERMEGSYQNYTLLIDCEARQDGLLAKLSQVVRRMIGGRVVWVGGRRCEIDFYGSAKEMEPAENYNYIPKVEISCKVGIQEDIFDRKTLPITKTIKIDSEVQ